MMCFVKKLIDRCKRTLPLQIIAGHKGLKKKIRVPEIHRPGLSLSGYLKNYVHQRILIFGNVETIYLRDLSAELRRKRIGDLLSLKTPAVIIAGKHPPSQELIFACEEKRIPLLRTDRATSEVMNKISFFLNEEFSPITTYHGTLVEAFGVGVLIQGDSSVGKSEAALGLIERGHRLVSDDVVKIRLREGGYLEGSGPELTRHLMEIRGIGIINVAHLYGAVCVRENKKIDLIIQLEEWDELSFYDRVGLDEKFCDLLGVKVPYHVLPLKSGRDIILLIETIVLNHRLKEMGYHSAKEFNVKLLKAIAEKQKKRKRICEINAQNSR